MNSIPFEEHLAHININIEYPLKDFMDDMAGVIAKDESNVIDFPPELTILDDETDEVHKFRFNTKDPWYIAGMFFLNKYGTEVGPSRLMKFVRVMQFITKWTDILIEKKLLLDSDFAVKEDFVDHLLKVRVNPRSEIIPKKEIFEYLKRTKAETK